MRVKHNVSKCMGKSIVKMIKISFPIGINSGKVLYGTGWRDGIGIKLKTGNGIRKTKTCVTQSARFPFRICGEAFGCFSRSLEKKTSTSQAIKLVLDAVWLFALISVKVESKI